MSTAAHNKNTNADGKRFSPSAYHLEHISMVNHRGEEKFIENIVVKFSISESLYSPTLVLDLSIKDSNNFFESFPCIGQETISLKLSYKEHESGIEKSIDQRFFVVEYPTYGRAPQNNHVQVYRIKAISEQAYISSHKKISRSYPYSTTSTIIANILERDCNLTLSEYAVSGESKSKIKWNCPYMTPFNAIEHLRARSYDDSLSPYYLYQSLNGKMNMVSHRDIMNARYGDSDVYQTYFDARQFSSDPNTTKDYAERATRILECSSNLKLSKVDQTRQGAFASESYSLDYTTKSYTQSIYQYSDTIVENTIEKKSVISEQFKISDGINTPTKLPSEFSSAHVEYIPMNTGAFDDDVKLSTDAGKIYNDLTHEAIHAMNAYRALSNNTTHDILVHGDFQLNPGKKVAILFPKALDPELLKEYLGTDDLDVYDKALSGKYFIAATEHRFEAGEYYCNCRIKRDSMSLEL